MSLVSFLIEEGKEPPARVVVAGGAGQVPRKFAPQAAANSPSSITSHRQWPRGQAAHRHCHGVRHRPGRE